MIENENLFNILNKLDDAVIITDRDKKIIFQNDFSIEIFENDFTSQIITNLIRDPKILESLEQTIDKNIETTTDFIINKNISDQSGELNFDVSIYPSKSKEEDNLIYIILKNVSIQRNIEKVKTSFVANVSHELKTPLSTIIGFIETIRTTAKDDKKSKDEFMEIINDEANRMDRLIDDLLIVSKIESNEHIHPTSKINLNKCVERVQKNLAKKLTSKNMKIEIKSKFYPAHVQRRTIVNLGSLILDEGLEFPIEIGLKPLRSENGIVALATIIDITERRNLESLVKRQQQDLMELSTPVIRLWDGIVVLPIVGTLDSERSRCMVEQLLKALSETDSLVAILDISGVPMVDTLVAQHLMKAIGATRLMGAECIVSGIRPEIANTIMNLGLDLAKVNTKSSMARALQDAFTLLELKVVSAPKN